MSTNPAKLARALNRLTVACLDEQGALEPAARHMGGARAARLRSQAARRGIFVHDLAASVVALGAIPARRASLGARVAVDFRDARQVAIGPHDGDDYAACAKASARTVQAYAQVLRLDLPSDTRFGLEQQYAEITYDSNDLRRLRWGATSTEVQATRSDASEASRRATFPAELDLSSPESWADDGGRVVTAA